MLAIEETNPFLYGNRRFHDIFDASPRVAADVGFHDGAHDRFRRCVGSN